MQPSQTSADGSPHRGTGTDATGTPATGQGSRPFLTALEVQELLHIDRSTVYRMADDGRLPSIRVGRTRRFPAQAIAELAAGSGPAVPAAAPAITAATAGPTSGPSASLSSDPSAGPSAGNRRPLDRDEGLQVIQLPPAAPSGPDPESTLRPVAQATIDVAADLLGVMMVVTDMAGRPVTGVANPCPWFAENSAVGDVLATCVAEWRDLAADPDLTPRFAAGALGFECARTFIRSGNSLVGMVLAGGISPADRDSIDEGLYHLDSAARDEVLHALPKIAAAISTQVPQQAAAADKENR